MMARYGAPSIEDYRRAYAGFGAEWPGDAEIRRRHVVAPDASEEVKRGYPVCGSALR
jgi:hypothetical protein